MSAQPVALDPTVDDQLELHDHPDAITDAEAMAGHAVYRAVDDLDDHSTGLDQ